MLLSEHHSIPAEAYTDLQEEPETIPEMKEAEKASS